MDIDNRSLRRAWELPFLAEPQEVAALRRIIRMHLTTWRLPALIDTAQLCVSELVTNVITHVGPGTPTTLALSMNGSNLRIEVRDPDARALPTLLAAPRDSEHGRGLDILTAVTERWGIVPSESGKTTWCELAAGYASPDARPRQHPRLTRAEARFALYHDSSPATGQATPPTLAVAEQTAADLIVGLLHWLHTHGCDAETVLDYTQMQFEAESKEAE